jgi:hypothetical protein
MRPGSGDPLEIGVMRDLRWSHAGRSLRHVIRQESDLLSKSSFLPRAGLGAARNRAAQCAWCPAIPFFKEHDLLTSEKKVTDQSNSVEAVDRFSEGHLMRSRACETRLKKRYRKSRS